ncbi:MAG: tyrosine-type recombinase/integrase [Candidatus Azambacteria bacterium]|nr:tyrosine-type recombinase/integrase [Candidatus Azambacteria bacterium]
MADIKELLKDYLDHLEIEKNRSIKTRVNYERYLKRFLEFSKVLKPEQITSEMVRQYRLWLNRQPSFAPQSGASEGKPGGLKKITQNYYLIGLRNFLKYLAKRDIKTLSADKIELGKQSERQVSFLEGNEIERLLSAPAVASRDKAILELLFSTGLRVSELCSLNRDSVNLKSGEFAVRGKGDKVRLVFLSETAKEAIKNYLEKRKDIDPALFIRNMKNFNKADDLRLTSRSIERFMKYYAAKAGLSKKITPHTLRHSFATDLLMNGADIRSVQELLGHSNITTTQIYTHVTDKKLREVHNAFHDAKRRFKKR